MSVRRIDYHWHLRQIMAAHNLWKTTELSPLLRDRGINLSAAQVYRLVTERPERLPLATLAALCDIFDCTPAEFIEPFVAARPTQAATGTSGRDDEPVGTSAVHGLRPKPARILPDHDVDPTAD